MNVIGTTTIEFYPLVSIRASSWLTSGVYGSCSIIRPRRIWNNRQALTPSCIVRRYDEDLIPFTQIGPRLGSPWEPDSRDNTASRLLRPEPASAAEPLPAEPQGVGTLEVSAAASPGELVPHSRPSLSAREEQQQEPSGRWRSWAAQSDPVPPSQYQSYASGARERRGHGGVEREHGHGGQPAGHSHFVGPPFRGSGKQHEYGRSGSRLPRSALISEGSPYGEYRSQLVDPVLFPPVPAAQEQPRYAAAVAPDGEPNAAADDRQEFEKELDAVVAQLEKVRDHTST